MNEIRSYRDLLAWQKAMDLVEAVYRLTKDFPVDERFGLVSQLRRAAVSVPSNIAEGYGRRTRADYIRFLEIARGSANEADTQILLAWRMSFVREQQAEPVSRLIDEVQRLLKALIVSLERSQKDNVRAGH